MMPKLFCLVRKHQWHNGWDEDQHATVWTCKRCGATRATDGTGPSSWFGAGPGGAGVGGLG